MKERFPTNSLKELSLLLFELHRYSLPEYRVQEWGKDKYGLSRKPLKIRGMVHCATSPENLRDRGFFQEEWDTGWTTAQWGQGGPRSVQTAATGHVLPAAA